MRFEITNEDANRITKWLKDEVYPIIITEQKESGSFNDLAVAKDCWEMGYPYTGAIGGGLTYSFSPTSLGLVTKVTYLSRFSLDLTDYESW